MLPGNLCRVSCITDNQVLHQDNVTDKLHDLDLTSSLSKVRFYMIVPIAFTVYTSGCFFNATSPAQLCNSLQLLASLILF